MLHNCCAKTVRIVGHQNKHFHNKALTKNFRRQCKKDNSDFPPRCSVHSWARRGLCKLAFSDGLDNLCWFGGTIVKPVYNLYYKKMWLKKIDNHLHIPQPFRPIMY